MNGEWRIREDIRVYSLLVDWDAFSLNSNLRLFDLTGFLKKKLSSNVVYSFFSGKCHLGRL